MNEGSQSISNSFPVSSISRISPVSFINVNVKHSPPFAKWRPQGLNLNSICENVFASCSAVNNNQIRWWQHLQIFFRKKNIYNLQFAMMEVSDTLSNYFSEKATQLVYEKILKDFYFYRGKLYNKLHLIYM